MLTSILSTDAVEKTPNFNFIGRTTPSLSLASITVLSWILKAGTINVLICISLTLITFKWVKHLASCCESLRQGKQAKVAPFVLSDKTTKNLSWFE